MATSTPAFDTALDADPREPSLVTGVLELRLQVRDAEVIEEILAIPDPRGRYEFAIAALRIGMLSLRTARGQVDVRAVRDEVERMLFELHKGLDEHRDRVGHDVTSVLREYFDPKDGRFAERVQRLVEDDGELARVIKGHVEGSDSALAQTLARHVGADSALLRSLDPQNTEGVVAGITRIVEDALGSQRKVILGEFSLDNREGALARLVDELKGSNAEIAREFSLDDEGSALSRLVHRVERAQAQITEAFTLDSETSPLARLRKELMGNAAQMSESFAEFQKKMEVEIAKWNATRTANAKSTAHGNEFEAALLRWLEHRAHDAGDLFEETRLSPGVIKSCKVGDAVVELGPEHRAAGARIAIEAKEDASYRLPKAREEIETRAQESRRRGRHLRRVGAHGARRLGTLPRDRSRHLRRVGRRRSGERRVPRSRPRRRPRALHARPPGRPPRDRLRRLRALDPRGGEAARGARGDPEERADRRERRGEDQGTRADHGCESAAGGGDAGSVLRRGAAGAGERVAPARRSASHWEGALAWRRQRPRKPIDDVSPRHQHRHHARLHRDLDRRLAPRVAVDLHRRRLVARRFDREMRRGGDDHVVALRERAAPRGPHDAHQAGDRGVAEQAEVEVPRVHARGGCHREESAVVRQLCDDREAALDRLGAVDAHARRGGR